MPRQPLIACPHCDTLHVRLDPGVRGRAECRCCGAVLYRRGWLSLDQWVALGWTCLAVFAIAQWFPIVRLSIQGLDLSLTYWQALRLCWDRGYYGVSVMTGLAGFWFPLLQIVLTLWVMQSIAARRLPPDLGLALRLLGRLGPWSMATVLILAILVSVVKIAGLARLQVEPGMLGFFALCFLLTGLGRWDARALWRQAEDAGLVPLSGACGQGRVCDACGCVQAPQASGRCLRCGASMGHARHGNATQVWALLLAAAVFYIPANVLPIMEVRTVMGRSEHTILGGVIELWRYGSWDLAVIVFVASVLVPVAKLLALAFLQLRGGVQDAQAQRQRTRLYATVEFVGQWSMLDVFVVVLMAAMANFPGLSQINVGPAALSFGAVVVLTMIAAMCHDPRRGWDALRDARLIKETHEP
ncbi:MAG: paraquat-inducible protein A [Castellaniella sp.]|uniref:paraquat-inducible protein A n=1 Tax=Castellaniella sp. TaxID=1955812 RepID=UPI002A36884A|nr:paraquat-inducible protein A [Castellaniella sp.]MDY0310301.1 paraquat-inducible protein A [Castellaniella sp.]